MTMKINLIKHTNGSAHALSLGMYLNEISKKDMAPLTAAQELELFTEYAQVKEINPIRAIQIRDKIVKSNLRFVITIAKQYEYPKAKREDLVSEGTFGLFRAFDKFDPKLGYRFLTFANSYINLCIKDYLHSTIADIVQPANRQRIDRLMNKAETLLRKKGIHHPTDEQLLEVYVLIKDPTDLNLDLATFQQMKRDKRDFNSISQTIGHQGDGEMTLGDTLRSNAEYDADHDLKKEESKNEINILLSVVLNPTEKLIVEYKCGLNGREEKTLEQIADLIEREPKYTRARIGQIYEKAIEKLKEHKKVRNKVRENCGSASDSTQLTANSVGESPVTA